MKRMGLPQQFSSSKRTRTAPSHHFTSTSSPQPHDPASSSASPSSPSSSTSSLPSTKKKKRKQRAGGSSGSRHLDVYRHPSHIARGPLDGIIREEEGLGVAEVKEGGGEWTIDEGKAPQREKEGEEAMKEEVTTSSGMQLDDERGGGSFEEQRPLLPIADTAEVERKEDLAVIADPNKALEVAQETPPLVTPVLGNTEGGGEGDGVRPVLPVGEAAEVNEEVEEEEVYEEFEGPSLYPLGYDRSAGHHSDVDEAKERDESQSEEKEEGEGPADAAPQSLPMFDEGEEEEEEQLEDYGLLQGEVLEGEDGTHHLPIDTTHQYRGLPMGISKRVVLTDDPSPLSTLTLIPPSLTSAVDVDAEGRVQPYPEPEKKVEAQAVVADDDAPVELPSTIPPPSLPSLPAPYPLPPFLPPGVVPPASVALSAVPSPVTVFPTVPSFISPAYEGQPHSPREDTTAFQGEVIRGIDATLLPPRDDQSELRGLPRQNRRVMFTDDPDGEGVVIADDRLPPPAPTPEEGNEEGEEESSVASASSYEGQDLEDVFPSPPLPYPVDCSAGAIQSDPNMSEAIDVKYFAQRYRIFSRYDQGIRLDPTGWYSVTLERIALHQAHRIACAFPEGGVVVVDAFAGVGGNAIAFARHPMVGRVVAVECDEARLSIAKWNAEVYGVGSKIEWVLGRWEEKKRTIKGDVVFLAPPWGGVGYSERESFKLGEVEVEGGGVGLYEGCTEVVGEHGAVALNLPRNVDEGEVIALGKGQEVEIEYNQCNGKVKTITAYFGPLVRRAR